MTKQFIWKLSACACAVLLGACTNNDALKSLPINATGSLQNGNSSVSGSFSGIAAKLSSDVSNRQVTEFGKQSTLSGSSLNSVMVDGHTVNLSTAGVASPSSNEFQRINNQLSYTRFGNYTYRNSNTLDTYAIAYGQETPMGRVPTTGTAVYVGTGIVGSSAGTTTAEFDVNYGQKQISGKVGSNQLSGVITGNAFTGERNGLRMQGNFFGPNAAELGGTFHGVSDSTKQIIGSFGAKKQE